MITGCSAETRYYSHKVSIVNNLLTKDSLTHTHRQLIIFVKLSNIIISSAIDLHRNFSLSIAKFHEILVTIMSDMNHSGLSDK